MAWIRAEGTIEINNGVRIVTRLDMCRYYQWLIEKAHWDTINTQLPKHGSHITVVNPKIHDVSNGYEVVKSFGGKKVTFLYNPEDIYISKVNFWTPVICDIEKPIKRLMKIKDKTNYLGLHMTFANVKFNNKKSND